MVDADFGEKRLAIDSPPRLMGGMCFLPSEEFV
jgi:hypothetical protein